MKYRMFLDDVREPRDIFGGFDLIGEIPIIWCQNLKQAQWTITSCGLPETWYLDHDLGGDDTTMKFFRWLEVFGYIRPGIHPPITKIHSENPVGRKNIEAFINSWRKLTIDG